MSFQNLLLAAAGEYHDDSSDEQTYTEFFGTTRASIAQDAGRLILGFLVEWGGPSTARVYPKVGRGRLAKTLSNWYDYHLKRIRELSKYSLWSADLREVAPVLCDLFDTLRRVKQPTLRRRKRSFGSTGTGKALHFLFPNLCVLWDERVVRNTLGLDEQAWSYLSYLRLQKTVLLRAIAGIVATNRGDRSGAVEWIVETHRSSCNLDAKEPVTKILDEAMYDPVFLSRQIKPLTERIEDLPWK